MESFSLLKYWRGGGGAALAANATPASNSGNTPIITTAHPPPAETDDDGNGDDGPFFDLEFTMPSEDGQGEEEDTGSSDEEEERELDLVVSSEGGSSGDALQSESCLSLSPSSSDDLFFKGRLVPLEPTSLVLSSSGPDSKPQLAATLLKSATKFRVFLLGFKKNKPMAVEQNDAIPASPKQQQQQQQGKFFIKFKIEEVPFVSLFTRDNSSRNPGSSGRVAKLDAEDASAAAAGSEEKKFTREVVQRYLNKIKPHYIRVSRKYAEKLRFSGLLSPGEVAGKDEKEADGGEDVATPPAIANGAESQKSQVRSLPAGLRVVRKRLGKSKSASSAIVVAPSLPVPAQRRDDTLLQQQDGIQSAIAHCKQSFNAAAKGSESPLARSMSDPVRSMSVPGEDGCQRTKGECI